MEKYTNNKAFTLLEVLIAMTIGVAMLGIILSIYALTMRSIGFSQNRSELSQNSRIIIERLTRDIRQARGIAAVIPQDDQDPENPPPNEIELRDGHKIEIFRYIKYYLSGADIHRQIREYYFSDDPSILVPFDAEDDFGNPAEISVIEDELIGQYVDSIKFYGSSLITIELNLKKNTSTHSTKTTIYGRNL